MNIKVCDNSKHKPGDSAPCGKCSKPVDLTRPHCTYVPEQNDMRFLPFTDVLHLECAVIERLVEGGDTA